MLPHAYATGGGFADVIQLLLDTHMDSALNTYGKCSVQADRLAQLGRQDRPSDNVTCKHLDTLYHPKTDGSEGSFAHVHTMRLYHSHCNILGRMPLVGVMHVAQ